MTRMKRMWKLSPGKSIAGLAVLVVAGAIAIGTGANLTTGSASPGNFATSGALSMTNDSTGQAKFQLSNVLPDFQPQNGAILFRNTGTVPGNFFVDPTENLSDATVAPRFDTTGSPIGVGTPIDATFESNPNYSNVRRLSKGLNWKVTKLDLCTISTCPALNGGPCESLVNVSSTVDPSDIGCYAGPGTSLANGKLYDGSGPKNIGSVPPGQYTAVRFTLDWDSSTDPNTADRAGVRSDWSIHVTAGA